EQVVTRVSQPRLVSNWITTEVFGRLRAEGAAGDAAPASWIEILPPERLAGLLRLLEQGVISGRIAKDVLDAMFREPRASAEEIVARKGWVQVSDESELVRVIEAVLAAHPAAVGDWQKGKKQSLGFLVGQVMKATRGQANPQLVNRLLSERLPPPSGP
ncbi:MAG: Asp-tRNA(Asn)/Glu-tRNA(Gln) amidotransferase GatCAB subunit B, partial [Candidatus Rokubacteria bacterium]|nr:Asp-tRNA(Asn)/Glu-tRNA(Gln) amidotransferase GatCAB subunit B [Candidatus Rokubacteria bacterium]